MNESSGKSSINDSYQQEPPIMSEGTMPGSSLNDVPRSMSDILNPNKIEKSNSSTMDPSTAAFMLSQLSSSKKNKNRISQ